MRIALKFCVILYLTSPKQNVIRCVLASLYEGPSVGPFVGYQLFLSATEFTITRFSYNRSQFVAQIFVHGESLKSSLVAVVVPERESLTSWSARNIRTENSGDHLSDTHFATLLKDPRVKSIILADLAQVAKKGGLKSFEMVRDIALSPCPWTVENELLTPTFKAKRTSIKKLFDPEIFTMYTKLE